MNLRSYKFGWVILVVCLVGFGMAIYHYQRTEDMLARLPVMRSHLDKMLMSITVPISDKKISVIPKHDFSSVQFVGYIRNDTAEMNKFADEAILAGQSIKFVTKRDSQQEGTYKRSILMCSDTYNHQYLVIRIGNGSVSIQMAANNPPLLFGSGNSCD